jgi:cytosine/adenosine deaminase-related metal-dependent hydrolase
MTEHNLTRRGALGVLGAVGGAAAGAALGGAASAAPLDSARDEGDARRENLILKGGYVLSMDDEIGDHARADVHVQGGKVVAVGPNLRAAGARIIDARDCVVMPGFVETHWHMWNSIWRGMINDATEYFNAKALAASYTVEDHYVAVRYAAMEAINAGITTCHNWAHGVRDFADIKAEMRAMRDSGIRGSMGYMAVIDETPTTEADLRKAQDWAREKGAGRLKVGMILDGAGAHFAAQVGIARELGLRPITDHGGGLSHPELLGPEFLYTHGTDVTPDAMQLIAEHGVHVGFCPGTDPMIGAGLPPVQTMLEGGVPLDQMSFTVDVTNQSPADPFALLRVMVNAGRIQQADSSSIFPIVKAAPDWDFSYRDALRLGTMGGADALGLGHRIGSLTPGKRADVIMVRLDDVNMLPAPRTNRTFQLVQHAQVSNVDTVIVDGYVRKESGRLVGVDAAELVERAAAAQVAIRDRASWPPIDAER